MLERVDLRHSDLDDVEARGANFTNAYLEGASISCHPRSRPLYGSACANLTGADLSLSELQGADLSNAILQGATFSRANLLNANLANARLRGANLYYANLQGADLSSAQLQEADMTIARLLSADLSRASLQGAHISKAVLQGTNLSGANLQGADLIGALMQGADLVGTRMQGANLRAVSLQGANLLGAGMQGADLGGARLQGSDLRATSMQGTDFWSSNLEGTDLRGAAMEGSNLRGIKVFRTRCPTPAWRSHCLNTFRTKADAAHLHFSNPKHLRSHWENTRKSLEGIRSSALRQQIAHRLSVLALRDSKNSRDPDRARWKETEKNILSAESRASIVEHLTCHVDNAPYVARGLMRNGRIAAVEEHRHSIAQRMREGKNDPTICPGVVGFTDSDWAMLDSISPPRTNPPPNPEFSSAK